ncbi:penicillin-binding transpeptidase domain-containing protein [Ligilactobacillus ceti]|uniref:penicillin-binding transpeptidase domain-containing protein n=1 Tax=Ligilactobacillus ceti TaxID=395085 RepID=UPI0004196ED3|nr:penicillin-binding transpeptidase domain-containing protein [Ligilactobacillus ceti]
MSKKNQRQMLHRNQNYNRKKFGKLLLLIVMLFFSICIGRFFYVAVFHNVADHDLKKDVANLYASTLDLKAKRGTIYDAFNQPIAEDTTTYDIYVVLPKQDEPNITDGQHLKEKDKEKAAKVLSKNLKIKYNKVLKMLSPENKDLYQVELGNAGKNLSLETKNKIEAAKIQGIKFWSRPARLYPNGMFASHLIGITHVKDGNIVGVTGLEAAYNKQLKGRDGVKKYDRDSRGIELSTGVDEYKKPLNGDNIYTTLNPKLQTYLESLMNQVYEKHHPKILNAALIDAKTGAILAASQRPTFNAQTKAGISDTWINTLLNDTYEPGSTMKIFTVSAAIESGVFNPNALYKSGVIKVDKIPIHDWNRKGWGMISYRKGFYLSSNTAMVNLEQKMGQDTWLKYIKKFGLLKKPNLHMGPEQQGTIQYEYPIDAANTAFGQGINVSFMQMLQGFTAVANNGKMLKPQLIKKIVDPNTNKVIQSFKPEVVGQPIKASTSKKLLTYMQDVVNQPDGTGIEYRIPGYKVAAKTGTAQIANPKGGYLTGSRNYTFSVVGMAPADNPKYLMYITMKQPKTFGTSPSNKILASIFNPMMKRVLDDDVELHPLNNKNQVKIGNYKNKQIEQIKKELIAQGLKVVVIGNGPEIKKQSVAKGETVLVGEKIILLTDGEKIMPDVSGWSRSDVARLANIMNVKIKIKGKGYAYEQSVKPNTHVPNKKTIIVKLK